MTDPTSMLIKRLADLQNEVNELREELQELTASVKTLSDDMYDIQADMTLIHNIEGYEDWRAEIGKPIKPVIEEKWLEQKEAQLAMRHENHAADCDYHCDQYWWECTCFLKPVSKPTDIVK